MSPAATLLHSKRAGFVAVLVNLHGTGETWSVQEIAELLVNARFVGEHEDADAVAASVLQELRTRGTVDREAPDSDVYHCAVRQPMAAA